MNRRATLKEASLQRILDAAATRLRVEGLSGAAIATVMADAGLTHGAFYAHFASKNELASAALQHALKENRQRWLGTLQEETWPLRLQHLARRYLTPAHRDQPADGCALAALATEAGRSDDTFRATYSAELQKSLHGICTGSDSTTSPDPHQADDAVALMALCIGALSLARAVPDADFSQRILDVCTAAAARLAHDAIPCKELANGY